MERRGRGRREGRLGPRGAGPGRRRQGRGVELDERPPYNLLIFTLAITSSPSSSLPFTFLVVLALHLAGRLSFSNHPRFDFHPMLACSLGMCVGGQVRTTLALPMCSVSRCRN